MAVLFILSGYSLSPSSSISTLTSSSSLAIPQSLALNSTAHHNTPPSRVIHCRAVADGCKETDLISVLQPFGKITWVTMHTPMVLLNGQWDENMFFCLHLHTETKVLKGKFFIILIHDYRYILIYSIQFSVDDGRVFTVNPSEVVRKWETSQFFFVFLNHWDAFICKNDDYFDFT